MNIAFKDWLLKDSEKWKPEDKIEILRMIKFQPEQAVSTIADNLSDWGMMFSLQQGEALLIHNSHSAAQELVEEYRKLYATDLAAIAN